jgi:hypothetical protein
MVNENNSNTGKIFRSIIILIIVAALGYFIYYLCNKNIQTNTIMDEEPINIRETYNDEEESIKYHSEEEHHSKMESMNNMKEHFASNENKMDYLSMDKNFEEERNDTNFPKQQLSAEELLPSDNSTLWAQVNPAGEGSLKDRNFLQSGYHIGINTVGQTLRNANQQLRSEPPNPQVKVSPWLQSTIEPDVGRKPMEIGGCA